MRTNNTNEEYGIKLEELSLTAGMCLRTSGCTMLFCEEGRAIVTLNFERRIIKRGNIVLIFPDVCLKVEHVSNRTTVRQLEITPILIDEATLSVSSSFWDYLFVNLILYPNEEQKALLDSWMKQMQWIVSISSLRHKHILFRNHIANLFIGLEVELLPFLGIRKDTDMNPSRQILNKFYRLVVKHCHTQHNVRFYADKLCITPYYLSKVTRNTMELSPKEIIDLQIVAEMKQMLLFSNYSVKEISNCFNFDTLSYMRRYFQKHTGMTPTEFKKSNELGNNDTSLR